MACIIGAGVTGLSLLLLLVKNGVDPTTITIIDPHFDGGDMARKWGPVQSNTPWSKTADALRRVALPPDIPDISGTTPLKDIADLLCRLSASIPCIRLTGFVVNTAYSSATDQWSVSYRTGSHIETRIAKAIFITSGSDPTTLGLPLPSIPLEYAMDLERLKTRVSSSDSVIIFGTMHSGTLVIKNLDALSVKTTAIYKGSTPFVWARDGAYNGIKEEAAAIADSIVAGQYRGLCIAPITDTITLLRRAMTATCVIYAMGFEPRTIEMTCDEKAIPSTSYDGLTGAIRGAPKAWGFGIAYPNLAPDGVHWDVSVAAFLTHIEAQLPILLQALR
jgi:hypothetical protein